MKKGMVVILMCVFVSWATPSFADDTSTAVQAGMGILGAMIDKASQKKDAVQESQEQMKVSNPITDDRTQQDEQINMVKKQKDAELEAFWVKEQPKLNQKIAKNKILKIKDLYVGMNVDDASEILGKKTGEEFPVVPIGESVVTSYVIFGYEPGFQPTPIIMADDYKRVIAIQLLPSIVDKLYNSAGLPGKDFAQKFVDNYRIIKMEPFTTNDFVQGWRFVSPEGYTLSITENKIILIEKIANSSEMKFD